MSGALPVAAVPLIAAALLAVVPARAGAWVGFGVAGITFVLVCRLAVLGGADALGTALALLASFVGVTTAWFAAHAAEARRAANALFQAVLGGALLATLADDLALGWIGLATGTLAVTVAAALPGTTAAAATAGRGLVVCGVALVLALFGIAVLALSTASALDPDGAAMGWAGLRHAAPSLQPASLNLAFCILFVAWGALAALAPLHLWLPAVQAAGPVAITGILSTLLLNAALANLLRLRGVMAACPGTGHSAVTPGGVLVLFGLVSVLGSGLLLWRERDVRRFLAVSTVGQGGLAAVAFGLGRTAAFAGLLQLVLHTLAKAALFQGTGSADRSRGGLFRTDRKGAWLVLAAGLAVAGLPPAGVFASEFLVLAEAMRQAPPIAFAAGLGVVVAAWAVLARLDRLLFGPTAPVTGLRTGWGGLLGAWANLALALVLGLAMPASLLALLRAAAQGTPR